MASISMKQLLEAGIHFGHQTRRWNPKMGRYIFGERHGIYIIDLQKTLRQLQQAYIAVRDVAADGGSVLFVGTKKQAQEPVKQHAERSGMFFVNNRWLGGTLTNWQTIQKSIKTLLELEESEASGKIEAFTKKEAIQMRKQRAKLEKNLCGIKTMNGVPRIMFVVDSHREKIAVKEADRLNIPCIGICDTNSDPDAVSIPVPGNDDAIRAIGLFCSIIADAAIEGRALYEKARAEEAAVKEKEADVAEEPQAKEAPAEEAPVEEVAEEAAAVVAEPASSEDTGA